MPLIQSKLACEECVFFYSRKGECRRHPPVVKVIDGFTQTRFPMVEKDEWCGDWSQICLLESHK